MSGDETRKLEAIRRRRGFVKWMWIAFLPLVLCAVWASAAGDTVQPLLALAVLYAGVFVYMGLFVQRFACPRCAARLSTGRRNFWQARVRFCPHCGCGLD